MTALFPEPLSISLDSGTVYNLYLDDKALGIRFKFNTFPVTEIYPQKWPHELSLEAGGRESRLALCECERAPLRVGVGTHCSSSPFRPLHVTAVSLLCRIIS